MIKKEKGITLIALVITIIVLLILAGVSIATLTGDNGLLQKSAEATEQTEQSTEKEGVGLAVTDAKIGNTGYEELNQTNLQDAIDKHFGPSVATIIDNKDGSFTVIFGEPSNRIYEIELDGSITGPITNGGSEIGSLPSTEHTKPYLPSNNFRQVEGTNLNNGLVITDGTNYWTWIEVPTSIFKTAQSENDYEKIENDMETYTGTLLSREDYKDEYYDDCGLTETKYMELKKKMLSSVYKNGGFWIGQYEAGTDNYTWTDNNNARMVVINKGKYPYNYVTCSEAQQKASEINSGNYTSSLMFGIQWDLILKHLQNHGIRSEELIENSTNLGNYSDSTFVIDNGQYTIAPSIENSFKLYTEETTNYVENNIKISSKYLLLTTGASKQNNIMGIYDLGGNISEWTLENSNDEDSPCLARGGNYYNKGHDRPISNRFIYNVSYSNNYVGFRPTLY